MNHGIYTVSGTVSSLGLIALIGFIVFLGGDNNVNIYGGLKDPVASMVAALISSISMILFSYNIIVKHRPLRSINSLLHIFVWLGTFIATFLAINMAPLFVIPIIIVLYVY
jgi:hypothetical protein